MVLNRTKGYWIIPKVVHNWLRSKTKYKVFTVVNITTAMKYKQQNLRANKNDAQFSRNILVLTKNGIQTINGPDSEFVYRSRFDGISIGSRSKDRS